MTCRETAKTPCCVSLPDLKGHFFSNRVKEACYLGFSANNAIKEKNKNPNRWYPPMRFCGSKQGSISFGLDDLDGIKHLMQNSNRRQRGHIA